MNTSLQAAYRRNAETDSGLVPMAARRTSGNAAQADEDQAEQKGNRKHAAFAIDQAVDYAGARNSDRYDGRRHDGADSECAAGDQGREGHGAPFVAEFAICGGGESSIINLTIGHGTSQRGKPGSGINEPTWL